MDGFWDILGLLAVMALVFAGAYFTSKLLSANFSRATRTSGLRVLDRLSISRDKSVLVVCARDTAYLLGVTNQSISVLGTWGCDAAEQPAAQPQAVFTGVIGKVRGFVAYARDAQAKLNEIHGLGQGARRLRTHAAQPHPSAPAQGDELDDVLRAVKARKDRLNTRVEDGAPQRGRGDER